MLQNAVVNGRWSIDVQVHLHIKYNQHQTRQITTETRKMMHKYNFFKFTVYGTSLLQYMGCGDIIVSIISMDVLRRHCVGIKSITYLFISSIHINNQNIKTYDS